MQNPHAALRAWMERSQRTYPDVAAALQIGEPHLSHLLNGGRTPSLALAVRISQLTGIPPESWVLAVPPKAEAV